MTTNMAALSRDYYHEQTFWAWMFCFPSSNHVMVPRRLFLSNVALCACIHVHMYT